MSTKKYATIVSEKTYEIKEQSRELDEWLVVTSDLVEPRETTYQQLKKSFIPAIIYWGWDSTIECELDVITKESYLRQAIHKAAKDQDLLHFLSGRSLEINLEQIPGKFTYENKGTALILVFVNPTFSIEAITPHPIDLEYEYYVKEDRTLSMNRDGHILNEELRLINRWKSSKKFTRLYLDEYQKETERLGSALIAKIIEDLKNKEE